MLPMCLTFQTQLISIIYIYIYYVLCGGNMAHANSCSLFTMICRLLIFYCPFSVILLVSISSLNNLFS